ncbi:MAG: FixH family protein [Planctomycetota bacterium]|nr:FixH family protein [Planctomycetota bacterium]
MDSMHDQSDGPGWIIIIGVVISLLVGMAMLMLMLAGCQSTPAVVLPSGPGWLQMRSADGTYQISLKIPDKPPLNQEITVEGVVSRSGDPIAAAAEVHFDGGMPQHGHGLAVPVETSRLAASGFRAEGVRFHMSGRWLITLDVREGPHLERARAWVDIP